MAGRVADAIDFVGNVFYAVLINLCVLVIVLSIVIIRQPEVEGLKLN